MGDRARAGRGGSEAAAAAAAAAATSAPPLACCGDWGCCESGSSPACDSVRASARSAASVRAVSAAASVWSGASGCEKSCVAGCDCARGRAGTALQLATLAARAHVNRGGGPPKGLGAGQARRNRIPSQAMRAAGSGAVRSACPEPWTAAHQGEARRSGRGGLIASAGKQRSAGLARAPANWRYAIRGCASPGANRQCSEWEVFEKRTVCWGRETSIFCRSYGAKRHRSAPEVCVGTRPQIARWAASTARRE